MANPIEWMKNRNLQRECEVLLKDCCDRRGYPDVALADAGKPYLTGFRLSGVAGTPDRDCDDVVARFNTVLQIDACAVTCGEAVDFAHTVRMKRHGWDRRYRSGREKDFGDVENGVPHVVLEIAVRRPSSGYIETRCDASAATFRWPFLFSGGFFMGSPAIFAQGSRIAIHTAVSGEAVWSTTDNLVSVTGFDGVTSDIDVTDSVGSRWLR